MERLSRLACYVGWPGRRSEAAKARAEEEEEEARRRTRRREQLVEEERRRQGQPAMLCQCNLKEATRRLLAMIESLLLWENTCNSISVVVAFNILFWGFVVLEVRGFAAASSAALVTVLCYSTLETQEEGAPASLMSQSKDEQVEKLVKKAKSTIESLMHLQQEQPRAFCTAMCTVSLGLWLIGRNLDSVLITYTICMSILIGPALLLRSPCKELSNKEWDSEIEEFLPAVTEDNLQVLKRAGETGDRSPTPPSPDMNVSNDNFDEELVGLRMPSHEDGSTDGLELTELELSIDGIRFQSGHFERGSSSSSSDDDEVDIGLEKPAATTRSKLNAAPPQANVLDLDEEEEEDDSDDSEFEIIDSCELAGLKNV